MGTKSQPRYPGPKYDLSNMTRRGPVKVTGALLAPKYKPIRSTRTPSPAAYNTVACMSTILPAIPSCFIGIRRDAMKKSLRTPAPNAYALPTTIGSLAPNISSAPKHTMSGRFAEPGQGSEGGRRSSTWYKSPGPARYSAVELERFKKQTPRPVMVAPFDQKTPGKRIPAPNAYFPPMNATSTYANAPQYTIGGRIKRFNPYYTSADKVPDWE